MSMATTQMMPQGGQLAVMLTQEQLAALVDIVDNIGITGKQAALLVSIQQAIASAVPVAPQAPAEASEEDTQG